MFPPSFWLQVIASPGKPFQQMQFTPQLIAQGKPMLQQGQTGNSAYSLDSTSCFQKVISLFVGLLSLIVQFLLIKIWFSASYPGYATIPNSSSQTLVLPMGMLSGQPNLISSNAQQSKPDMSKVCIFIVSNYCEVIIIFLLFSLMRVKGLSNKGWCSSTT